MALEPPGQDVDSAFTRPDPRGLAFEATFGGATSFLRRRYSKDLAGVDLAVTGIAFDQATSHRPGARLGPRAIREASSLQPCYPPYGWDFDPLSACSIIDYGDLAYDHARLQDFPGRLQAHIATILNSGARALSLGGDHYITLPILRAYAAKHGPMAVIQFDAHSDLWPDDDPARIDHGTMMYKAVREGLVVPERSVQIGIRTHCADYLGMNVIDAFEVHARGPAAVAERVRAIVADAPSYLSFDIDALDPAFAPGTGTPVWNGLTPNQAAVILRALAGLDIRGADVVEVCPAHDPSGVTAVMGAHVATELVCLCLWGKGKGRG